MKLNLSVILCTHNPQSDYLRRALQALRGQSLPLDQWEFLLVDNGSKDCLANTWDLAWHPHARHIREEELGLTPARLRGIQEAAGHLLVFVDDDNELGQDYLQRAVAISRDFPNLGAFGAGALEPEFEIEVPAELVSRLPLLALRSVAVKRWSNNPEDSECIPWGAGLCVTRQAAEAFRQLMQKLNVSTVLGRRGQQLFCGEDDVFSWASVRSGLGFGVFPELKIRHLISAGRLNRRYFVRLINNHAYSHTVLRFLLTGVSPKTMTGIRYVHLLLHGLKNGWFSMKCQWAQSRGEDLAARFLSANGYRPLDPVEDLTGGSY